MSIQCMLGRTCLLWVWFLPRGFEGCMRAFPRGLQGRRCDLDGGLRVIQLGALYVVGATSRGRRWSVASHRRACRLAGVQEGKVGVCWVCEGGYKGVLRWQRRRFLSGSFFLRPSPPRLPSVRFLPFSSALCSFQVLTWTETEMFLFCKPKCL